MPDPKCRDLPERWPGRRPGLGRAGDGSIAPVAQEGGQRPGYNTVRDQAVDGSGCLQTEQPGDGQAAVGADDLCPLAGPFQPVDVVLPASRSFGSTSKRPVSISARPLRRDGDGARLGLNLEVGRLALEMINTMGGKP